MQARRPASKVTPAGHLSLPDTRAAIEEFKGKVAGLYGDRLRNIILYGSWARGDATEESDIDLAVVIEGEVVPGKEIDRMIDIITDINLRHAVLLSVFPISVKGYHEINSTLLINLRREGVAA